MNDIYRKYKEQINYIFFGVLTTLVNFVSYFLSYKKFGISNVPSNIIAWILSVVFAFIVNKLWVFESKSWRKEIAIKEFISFVSVRLFTGIFDTTIMYLGVDILKFNEVLVKITSNIIVLITNYIGSKVLIFRKK